MHWLKRNLRKIGIIVAAGLFLAWIAWASFSILGMHASVSTAGRVQVVPIVNATALAVDVLKQQDDKAQRDNSFFGVLLNALGGSIGTIFLAVAAIVSTRIGFRQWRGNNNSEREKQAEGRFQSAVTGLGDEKEGAQIGAAILLRTFLRSGYEQFYVQTFDLAVANLRRQGASRIVQHQLWNAPQNPDITLPLTTLDQALIVVFKEAFPLARDQEKREPPSLDATGVQLDNAYLVKANLKQMWGPQASLRKANLSGANLSEANLSGVDLRGANLSGANLRGAYFSETDLGGVIFTPSITRFNFSRADLREANLSGADLSRANLIGADLRGAYFSGADLSRANLSIADLRGAYLRGADLSEVDLSEVDLRRAKGLTKEQRAVYRGKGALVDEEPAPNVSQEPVSISPPLEPESAQPISTQGTSPTPDASQGNGTSSHAASDKEPSGEAEKGDDVGRAPEKHRERDDRSPGK